ncbi:rho gtpase-activating protein 68f [Anaeramoeba flamelloides]|uniref:Rho gtpase-activating protein 68f n=1 Tax=Anaeramoeba flamelloides TaxID=1746091 RepID=A0ABQ8XS27_9EUKA|nr:rho gtpase-activating protein 68f [Anaeramoeba flamelloides]
MKKSKFGYKILQKEGIGVYQGDPLSPLMFGYISHFLIEEIKYLVHHVQMFADDLILIMEGPISEIDKKLIIIFKRFFDSELFLSKGNPNAINAYKLKYDCGLPVNFENEKNPKNVSNLLMQWIIKIPESIIPKQLISQFIETTNQNESKEKIMKIKQLIEQLPLGQFKILENIIGFIRKLINQDQTLILNIFSSILFFKKRFDLENGNENKNYVELLQILLNNYNYFFLNEELEWEEDNESSNDNNSINNEQYEVEENEKSVIKTSKGYVELFKAVALYDFVPDGESPDDLPIKKEEVLSIVSTEDSDWWYGSIVLDSNGKQIDEKYGYFPSNYVKKISEEDWQQISDNI